MKPFALLAYSPPPMPADAHHRPEGYRLYKILRARGWGHLQAYAIAVFASYGESTYKTEAQIAKFCRCCDSTVTKAIKKAKVEGIFTWRRIPVGEIPPGGWRPTTTGLSLRTFHAFGVRSLRRRLAIYAKNVARNFWRLARDAENRADRAEARLACADLRGPPG